MARQLATNVLFVCALVAAGGGQRAAFALGGQKQQQCTSGDFPPSAAAQFDHNGNYSAVFAAVDPAKGMALEGLAPRSASERDHTVIDAAARAWSTMAGWGASGGDSSSASGGARVAYLAQPSRGANFAMYLAELGPGGAAPAKSAITERFMFVLEGAIEVEVNGDEVKVAADAYAYLPPASEEFLSQAVTSAKGAKLLVVERIFAKAEGMPVFKAGKVADAPARELQGGSVAGSSDAAAVLRPLLPDSDEWDMDVAVLDVRPGGSTAAALRPSFSHLGAMLLSGEGIFRLGGGWYPVRAGDAVWAAPYAQQWFAALGAAPARLLVYRDRNVDPLFSA